MLFTCQCGRERVSRQEEKQTIKWKMNSHTFSKYQCACLSRLLNFCLDYRNRLIPPLSHVSCLLLLLMPSSSSSCNNNTTLRLWSPGLDIHFGASNNAPTFLFIRGHARRHRHPHHQWRWMDTQSTGIYAENKRYLHYNYRTVHRWDEGMGWEVRMDRWHRKVSMFAQTHTKVSFFVNWRV